VLLRLGVRGEGAAHGSNDKGAAADSVEHFGAAAREVEDIWVVLMKGSEKEVRPSA